MTVISVLLDKKLLDDINQNIIESRRSKLIDKYLIEEYQLPNEKEELIKIAELQQTDNMIIQPFSLSDEAMFKLDKLIQEFKSKLTMQREATRSMIFRDVLYQFRNYVKLNPIVEAEELQFVHLTIAASIKEKIDHYITKRDRSQIINDFIINHYVIGNENVNKLKEVPGQKRKVGIYFTSEAIQKLDSIVNSFNGNIKRTHIIRDVLDKLVIYLEENDLKGKILEKKVKMSLDVLYNHDPKEFERILEEYAKKHDREI